MNFDLERAYFITLCGMVQQLQKIGDMDLFEYVKDEVPFDHFRHMMICAISAGVIDTSTDDRAFIWNRPETPLKFDS